MRTPEDRTRRAMLAEIVRRLRQERDACRRLSRAMKPAQQPADPAEWLAAMAEGFALAARNVPEGYR